MFAVANVPAAQISHFERSAFGAKPSSHATHCVDPGGATWPAEQFDAQLVEPSSDTVPASHSTHEVRASSR